MSVLCIDAGNSRLKWGVRDGGVWLARGMHLDAVEARPARILACNVAGDPSRQSIGTFAAGRGLPVEWLLPCAAQGGVTNGYDHPAQLGADRWAALIGARALHRGDCVVVMSGTATTIDVLTADGRFRGGLILPGLALMREALAGGTANLPTAAGDFAALPRNTFDAIASGACKPRWAPSSACSGNSIPPPIRSACSRGRRRCACRRVAIADFPVPEGGQPRAGRAGRPRGSQWRCLSPW